MAMVVYWYDFVCFGIIAAAIVGSLWVLWRKERSSRLDDEESTMYHSLLDPDPVGVAYIGSDQLWTSCWRGVHPGWLVLTRFVSFVVMAGFLTWDILVWDATIFVYYTEWTFTLIIVYFALGTVISAYGCWVHSTLHAKNKESDQDGDEPRIKIALNQKDHTNGSIKLQYYNGQKSAEFWGYLMQKIYQTCGGAVILTDTVYWCIIFPFLSGSRFSLDALTGCMHTLNLVFLLLETTLNNLPFPWFRMTYFILWSCIYVVFQWVIHACGFTWWPYPFLELDTPWAPLWYLALAIIHIPCYVVYTLIVKAKNTMLLRMFPDVFVVLN